MLQDAALCCRALLTRTGHGVRPSAAPPAAAATLVLAQHLQTDRCPLCHLHGVKASGFIRHGQAVLCFTSATLCCGQAPAQLSCPFPHVGSGCRQQRGDWACTHLASAAGPEGWVCGAPELCLSLTGQPPRSYTAGATPSAQTQQQRNSTAQHTSRKAAALAAANRCHRL